MKKVTCHRFPGQHCFRKLPCHNPLPPLVAPEPCLSLNLTHLHLYVQQDIKETVLIAMEVLTRSANVPIYHVKPAFNILHRGSIVRITHCSIERSWFIWFLIEPASFTEFQPSLRPCQCRRQRHIQVAKTHTKTRTKTSHYSIEQTFTRVPFEHVSLISFPAFKLYCSIHFDTWLQLGFFMSKNVGLGLVLDINGLDSQHIGRSRDHLCL